ncbi:TPA: hypothetical protein L6B30_20815 [Pseudomonas aeruginosa]|nr:hypothetical protein [Pseudomonas aeruginosa]
MQDYRRHAEGCMRHKAVVDIPRYESKRICSLRLNFLSM